MEKGTIFNVQKCSIHDGRGMRTTVFFKGCGLRCLWCANPESISFKHELSFNPAGCMGCGLCLKMCAHGATYLDEAGKIVFDRKKCTGCGCCADMCCTEARHCFGEEVTVDELFRRINQDRFYYQHSGGGVTFSGGESLLQPEFLRAIAQKCRDNGIHVALETCGFGEYEKFRPALDYVDFIYFDVKHMDTNKHKIITGHGNEVILGNLRRINEHGIEIVVRTPVVPGYNADRENILETARLCAELSNVTKYELLAYHKLGINKYRTLDIVYPLDQVEPPYAAFMDELKDAANEVLLPVDKKCIYNKDNDLD